MRTFIIILTYLEAFILGTYYVSEVKFNHPIETHRWLITSFLFVMGLIQANKLKK